MSAINPSHGVRADRLASGQVLSGFVERVGDPVPLVAADGTSAPRRPADGRGARRRWSTPAATVVAEIAIAVPAHWNGATLRALRDAMRAKPSLSPNGIPVRLVSDAVASLTALQRQPRPPVRGVVALLDFGGGGTSITLADAAASFEPIETTTRFTEFSGDQIDQALLAHVLDGIADADGIDPAGTAAVGSLTALREECRLAKERLSDGDGHRTRRRTAGIPVDGPGDPRRARRADRRAASRRAAGAGKSLERNRIGWPNVSAVVTVGGGASIPLITQRLSEHSQAPVVTTPQPALDAAVGAALFAAYGADADAQTGVAPP